MPIRPLRTKPIRKYWLRELAEEDWSLLHRAAVLIFLNRDAYQKEGAIVASSRTEAEKSLEELAQAGDVLRKLARDGTLIHSRAAP